MAICFSLAVPLAAQTRSWTNVVYANQSTSHKLDIYLPETYISSDDPPFYIQHGSADVLIPYLQSKSFADKLSPVIGSNKVNCLLISGAGHGTSEFFTNSHLDVLAAFLDTYLKNTSEVDQSN